MVENDVDGDSDTDTDEVDDDDIETGDGQVWLIVTKLQFNVSTNHFS
jgi:hypothetical protein